jgi:hypothetical protein
MGLAVLLEEIRRLILGIYKSLMNVEIGAEAALFPEKEYINRIAVAVCTKVIYMWSMNYETYFMERTVCFLKCLPSS